MPRASILRREHSNVCHSPRHTRKPPIGPRRLGASDRLAFAREADCSRPASVQGLSFGAPMDRIPDWFRKVGVP